MTSISLQELHAQGPFLRRLARALVRDEAAAEDLVQETWIAALEGLHGPRENEEPRGWLTRLLRNRARSARRAEARRRARELAAESRSQGRADVAVAEHVLAAVLALDEPYRGLVLRRYYHDMTPTEIARREDVPLKTVEARLRRAREELRRRLDDACGERTAWCVALLAVERPVRYVSTGVLAACAAGVCGVAVVAVMGWRWNSLGGAEGMGDELVAPRVSAGTVRDGGPTPDNELEASDDATLARVSPAAEPVPEEAAEALSFLMVADDPVARVEGRVLAGLGAEPWVALVPLSRFGNVAGEPLAAACEPGGAFAIEVPLARERWTVERVRLIAVAQDARPVSRVLDVAAGAVLVEEVPLDDPGAVVEGVALDRAGAPLADATVRVGLDGEEDRLRIGPYTVVAGGQALASIELVTDAHGRFRAQGLAPWRHRVMLLPADDDAGPSVLLDDARAGVVVTLPREDLALRATLDEIRVRVVGPTPAGVEPLSGVAMVRADGIDEHARKRARARRQGDLGLEVHRLPQDGRLLLLAEDGSDVAVTFVRVGFEPLVVRPAREARAGELLVALTPVSVPPLVAVRVVAQGGPAPEGVAVRLEPSPGSDEPFRVTVEGALGSGANELVLRDLPAGRYDVIATPPEGAQGPDGSAWLAGRTTLDVAPEGETLAVVRLERGAQLAVTAEYPLDPGAEVRLILMRREPGAGLLPARERLTLHPRGTPAPGASTPLTPAVPLGSWRARMEVDGEVRWIADLVVTRVGNANLSVDLTPAGAFGR
jgi:RNA polymerase sigma-70 factor (ECF subfamily)